MENVQHQLTIIIYVWFPEQCSQYLRLYSVSSSYSCESTPYTNRKNRKGANCARRLWFKRHEMCSHSFRLIFFSDFPGLHDSHRFQQLKFSFYGCQPTAQSANVGGKTRDNKDEWRHTSPRTLAYSRQAWPPNPNGLEHTVTERLYSSSNITLCRSQ